jgi:multidrug resistance efflux pump
MTNRAEQKASRSEPPDAAASGQAGEPAVAGARSFTARMQHQHLEAALKGWGFDGDTPEDSELDTVPVEEIPIALSDAAAPAAPQQTPQAGLLKKLATIKTATIIKSAVALLVALVLGWMPVQRLLATTSTEAVINARVVTVRTPIAGEVSGLSANLEAGQAFQAGDVLLTVKNPRADSVNLDNLKRSVAQLNTEIAALRAKQTVLKDHRTELAAQKDRYRSGRVETLERQIEGIDAQIASADAQHQEALKRLVRARALFSNKNVAESQLDSAVRDESVAFEALKQFRVRRKAAQVELAAARAGTFITDGYNDMSQSAQRGLQTELELADVSARLAGTQQELAAVQQDLAREANRTQELSTAVIRAGVSGRIWETMAAPGEYVTPGQPLMRLLDCGNAIVTASVSQSVFQKLAIGQQATFKPSDGGQPLDGRIIDISGLAAGPSNDAIQSKLLSGSPFHVTLKFPELAQRKTCQISRAGLVTFDTASSPVKSAALRPSLSR